MRLSQTSIPRVAGRSLARLIRHVHATSELIFDPPDLRDRLRDTHPCIVACWHGQFMMLSVLAPPGVKVAAMVARHGDADVVGEAMRVLGVELIRGAGAGVRRKDRGGAAALRASVRALNEGASVVMTADVPPGPARVAGLGIVTIAQFSGKPIVPVAAASSRFLSLDTWSRMTINLPYSRLAYSVGEPVFVPRNASPEALEAIRAQLERSLNRLTAKAYDLAKADITRATPLDQLAAKTPPSPGLALRVYRKSISLMRPLAPLLLWYRERQGKEEPSRRSERLGKPHIPRPEGRLVWIHAASVGETNVALPVIVKLVGRYPDLNILLTTGTTTSAALATKRLPARTLHQFVPLDAPEYARSFFDHWKPDLAILTESEIWPNLILAAAERGVSLVLMNARMSPRSMRRWRRHAKLGRPLFSRFSAILAQNEKVARAIRFLGAPNVIITGNIKIDTPAPPINFEALGTLKKAIGSRPNFLAASTHPGEETIIADAHKLISMSRNDLLTIIVPRHPDRAAEIQSALESKGLKAERRSVSAAPSANTQVYIADTIGELGTFYALCPVAFVGGSLVPQGGQNPFEAVRHGTAVLSGPLTHNFQDAYTLLASQGGGLIVKDAGELARKVESLLDDEPHRAATANHATRAIDQLSGAMDRTLEALAPYLDRPEQGGRSAPS